MAVGKKKRMKRTDKKTVEAGTSESTGKPVSTKEKLLRIVGIGASAGGLEAIEQFFENMPSDKNIAFVIVQHLDPKGHSSMPQILSRFTRMPVEVAEDGVRVKPNSIYLLPPNKNMGIQSDTLYLQEPTRPPGLRLPIDFFFRSLAKEMGPDAICIILSGTGTDGTLGLRAIKAELGTVFVQAPESARYDGMPRSAVDTGLADFILKPNDMPERLIQFVEHSVVNGAKFGVAAEEAVEPLKQVFAIMRARTGHDFSRYKQTTIRRRLQRRMSVNQVSDVYEYASLLKKSEDEIKALLKDLLISVTNFFRDPEAFEALKRQMKELIKGKPGGSEIRVWVAGCATGEEAYSVAIIIQECLDELDKNLLVQMYGTDIDIDALQVARTGKYPSNIAADLTPERLKRFFIKENDTYRVKKEIREAIVFAPQNFIKDPPFSRMDLICCRNLLIYLDTDIQRRLLPLLHYALRPGGILFLGPSETAGESADLFVLVERKWKIYQRREKVIPAERLQFPAAFAPKALGATIEPLPTVSEGRIPEAAEKIFLDSYAPTFAVIDEKYRLVYVRGRTGRYLEIASGQPAWSVLDMAREGLRTELASAIYRATAEKKRIVHEGVRVRTDGGFQTLNLTVAPLTEPGIPPGLLIVVFQEVGPTVEEAKARPSARGHKRIVELENELQMSKENLQTTIEELEATNEELKSANEELQSNNEELQSTNEELDTSREELQSLNEELSTLNAELVDKNELLSKANDDLKNFLNRTDIALIFLDEELRIRSYTPATSDVFNMRDIDVGRPIGEITCRLAYQGVVSDAEEVLRSLRAKEMEVQRKDGCWYKMRILPYVTAQNVVSGLVMSFLDIDEQKKAADELAGVNLQLEDLARFPQENPNPVMRVKKDGTILYANAACSLLDSFKCRAGRILPRQYRKMVAAALAAGSPQKMEVKGRERVFALNLVPVKKAAYVNIYGDDITERKKAEEQIKKLMASTRQERDRLSTLVNSIPDEIWFADAQGNFTLANPSARHEFALDPTESMGVEDLARSLEVYRPDGSPRPVEETPPLRALKGETIENQEETVRTPASGELRYRQVSAAPVKDSNGNIIGSVSVARDVTELKKVEESLRETRDYLDSLINYANAPIVVWDPEFKITRFNHAFEDLTGRTATEVMGKKLDTILPPDHRDDHLAKVRKAGAKGAHWEVVEVPVQHVDGLVRTVLWNSATILGADGKTPVATIAQGEDITERKQAQEALQESLNDLNRAQAVAYIGSWRLDLQGNRLLWSDETYRIFGIPEGTPMSYEVFLSSVHPDDREYVDQKWKAALQGKEYDIEHRIVVDDEVRWVRERAELEIDSNGKVKGGFGTVQDITERKRSEEQYRTIVRTAMDGFWRTDIQGKILDVNDSYCELVGYSREELLTMSIGDVEAVEVPEETARHVERVKERGYDRFETRHRTKNGEIIDVEVSVNYAKDEGGQFFVFLRDITERKKVEQVKDEFIGLVSHELRTPLTVISGSLRTAMSQGLSQQDVQELLQNATEGTDSLEAILENMLELSRYQAGRLQLRVEMVSIADTIRTAVGKLKRQGITREFLIDIPGELPPVEADPVRVERILFNLMENAAKYSPEDGKIIVSSRMQNGFVVTSIIDQGLGISPNDQLKIFELFQRLEPSRRLVKGVGLGLLVCKRLVEAQGGWIKVESEPGKGSTFSFALPKHRMT
jgi:two-component system CheB/CheR fusion protein